MQDIGEVYTGDGLELLAGGGSMRWSTPGTCPLS